MVDPRRSETAELADEHVFVRPGTDAWLLLAMLATLFEEGLDRPGRLAGFTKGYDALKQAVAEWKPEAVAELTGVPAATIRRLARELAAAPKAAVYGRIGVSVQEFGGLCQWAIYALNLATGNLDRRGGACFPTPAVDLVKLQGRGSYGRWRSKVRGLPEAIGELPVATLAEDMLDPRAPQIRALVTTAGNPVLSSPNGRQLEQGLAGLEFMVSIDYYRNETTRFANLILPPTAALEHDHYDLVFHALAIRNTARYSPPLFAPAEDTRHDWQILHELQRRLAAGAQAEGAALAAGGGAARAARAARLPAALRPARRRPQALLQGPHPRQGRAGRARPRLGAARGRPAAGASAHPGRAHRRSAGAAPPGSRAAAGPGGRAAGRRHRHAVLQPAADRPAASAVEQLLDAQHRKAAARQGALHPAGPSRRRREARHRGRHGAGALAGGRGRGAGRADRRDHAGGGLAAARLGPPPARGAAARGGQEAGGQPERPDRRPAGRRPVRHGRAFPPCQWRSRRSRWRRWRWRRSPRRCRPAADRRSALGLSRAAGRRLRARSGRPGGRRPRSCRRARRRAGR